MSVDPLQKKYPFYTPYQFASNSPVLSVDIDGRESNNSVNPTESGWYGYFDQFKADKISYKNSSWIGPVWNWKPAIFVSNTLTSAYNQNVEAIQSLPSVPHLMKTTFSNSREAKTEKLNMLWGILSTGMKWYGDITGQNGGDRQADAFENTGGTALNGWMFGKGMDMIFPDVPASNRGFNSKSFTGNWVSENTKGWSQDAIEYQEYVTGVKAGNAYEVNGVRFDGVEGNKLIEAKSSYDNFVSKKTGKFYDWFKGKQSLIDQAQRQIKAANGATVEWNFKSQKTLEATQNLFKENNIEGITLKYNPKP